MLDKLSCLLLVPAIIMGTPLSARAEWQPKQRTDFMNDCIGSCRENPKVKPSQRDLCASACGCVMSESEKFMTPADYDAANAATAQSKSTPKLDRMNNAVIPMCNRRAFGP